MKKFFALALLLSLGMMVGCGEEPKKTGSTKTTTTGGSTTTTTTMSSGSH